MRYSSVCAESKQKQKSNTSFKSVKTLRLFVCTHNNNKTCFCKIMKANRMLFLPSRSVNLSVNLCVYLCLTDSKNISIKSEMENKYSQILHETCIQAHHYCRDDEEESVSPTSSLKLRTKESTCLSVNY